MRVFAISALLSSFISFSSFADEACPNFAGEWNCTYNSETSSITITQDAIPNGMRYIEQDANGSHSEFMADGVPRTNHQQGLTIFTQASCADSSTLKAIVSLRTDENSNYNSYSSYQDITVTRQQDTNTLTLISNVKNIAKGQKIEKVETFNCTLKN